MKEAEMTKPYIAIVQFFNGDKPIGAPDTFTDDTWKGIVGRINYQIRVEIAPYWDMCELRMEARSNTPIPHETSTLNGALFALSVAWGMTSDLGLYESK
jgi:hypothetical protein